MLVHTCVSSDLMEMLVLPAKTYFFSFFNNLRGIKIKKKQNLQKIKQLNMHY